MCVCVCVNAREREGERVRVRERDGIGLYSVNCKQVDNNMWGCDSDSKRFD